MTLAGLPQQGHIGSALAIRRARLKAIVAIELGTCRCIGSRAARTEAFGYVRVRGTSVRI
jgi:hypothetical protein